MTTASVLANVFLTTIKPWIIIFNPLVVLPAYLLRKVVTKPLSFSCFALIVLRFLVFYIKAVNVKSGAKLVLKQGCNAGYLRVNREKFPV